MDTIQRKVDALISALAGIAFNSLPKPGLIGNLTWPSADTATPVLTSPSVGSIDLGTSTANVRTTTFLLKGSNLTKPVSLTVSGSGFTLSTGSVSAADANNGVTITITHTDSTIAGGTANGTLTITSDEIQTKTINITATKGSSVDTRVNVTVTLTGCTLNGVSSGNAGTAPMNGSFSGTLVAASGYQLPITDIAVTMGGQNVSFESGSGNTFNSLTGELAIGTVTGAIEITATATQSSEQSYVQGALIHLDGLHQGNTAGSWPNIASGASGSDFTIVGATKVEKGYQFDGADEYGYSANDSLLSALSATGCTIEVCFTPLTNFEQSSTARVLFTTNTVGKICAIILKGTIGQHADFKTASANGTETGYELSPAGQNSVITGSSGPQCLSMSAERMMLNGTVYATKVNAVPVPETGNGRTMMVGGRLNGSNFVSANAIIHSIRIYSSQLSESQMRENQNADKSRFDLNITIANGNS